MSLVGGLIMIGCNGASGNNAVDGVACSSSLSSSLSRHRTCIRQQSCRRPTDFGGGVARVVDLVDFWDRRGGSAVSSDVVAAPRLAHPRLRGLYQSGKLVKGSRGVTQIGACAG
eukprot:g19182.t1